MIRVRPLGASEWPAFKDFRLMALESAPGMFATSYDEASARSPEAWQETIAGPNHQVFGLFDAAQLIGITGVFGAGMNQVTMPPSWSCPSSCQNTADEGCP